MSEPERQGEAGGSEGPSPASPLEMDPETMRELGYRAVDQVLERWLGLGDRRPWAGGLRADLEPLFHEPAPEDGRDPTAVMERALNDILVRAGSVDHPRFFAFVPSSPTWPAVLATLLSTGFNTFQGTWLESAGPSQIELVVLDWFREWLGYPEGAGGLFTSGGSAANLDALVAARIHAGEPDRPVVYLSDQGHSSLARAARIAGIPEDGIRRIATDDRFRMRVDALARALDQDRADGRTPVCVCATAGATNTGATDPMPELAALCRELDVWLHVDAAYGGFAILTERGREAFRGLDQADSVTLDPHKWLFQPYETGCLMVRDVTRLAEAFRVMPEYLQDAQLGRQHVNFADRGLQLTRTFRALRVWMSVQTFGVAAHRQAIDRALDLAQEAGRRIDSSPELELLSPPTLGVVCFRYQPEAQPEGQPAGGSSDPSPHSEALEALNTAIQDRINQEGTAMMSSTRLRGEYSLRLCILSMHSRWEDVEATLSRIEALGRELTAR